MNKIVVANLCLMLFMGSCVKDKPNPDQYQIPNATHKGIVITNEGSYGNNNGEISFLDQDTKTIYNQLFYTANSRSLGDVVQSITLMNGYYYIAVNNSNKIVVIHPNTFEEFTTIHAIQSPRYITQVSKTKAYISSLYSNEISVLDLISNAVTKRITLDFPSTEKMLALDGYCYITNWDTSSNLVYKVNTVTDVIEKKIKLEGRASHDIVADSDQNLWILSGNKYLNKLSFLTNYDIHTDQLKKSYGFKPDDDPIKLAINADGKILYFINVDYSGSSSTNGLYRMHTSDTILPAMPWIRPEPNTYFWAMGIDSVNNHIYLSDPKGFVQKSTVYEYNETAVLINRFTSGIGTNGFLFK